MVFLTLIISLIRMQMTFPEHNLSHMDRLRFRSQKFFQGTHIRALYCRQMASEGTDVCLQWTLSPRHIWQHVSSSATALYNWMVTPNF